MRYPYQYEYTCDEFYKGGGAITCLNSGEWSEIPVCSGREHHFLFTLQHCARATSLTFWHFLEPTDNLCKPARQHWKILDYKRNTSVSTWQKRYAFSWHFMADIPGTHACLHFVKYLFPKLNIPSVGKVCFDWCPNHQEDIRFLKKLRTVHTERHSYNSSSGFSWEMSSPSSNPTWWNIWFVSGKLWFWQWCEVPMQVRLFSKQQKLHGLSSIWRMGSEGNLPQSRFVTASLAFYTWYILFVA